MDDWSAFLPEQSAQQGASEGADWSAFSPQEPPASPMPVPSLEHEQMQGWQRELALPASGMAKGLSSALDLISKAAPYAGRTSPAVGQRAPPIAPDAETSPVATPPVATQAAQALGAIDRPDLQPQTERERVESAAAQGVGSSLPMLPLGGIAGAAPTLLSGAGGGAGSYEGEKLGEKIGYPNAGSIIGGAAGGLVGGALGGGLVKGANAIAGNYGPAGAAYKEAGVPLNFTGNKGAAAYSSQSMGGSGRTLALAEQESEGFGKAVEDTASALGKSSTVQELGNTAQSEGNSWIKSFQKQSGELHNKVSSLVGAKTPVDMANTQAILNDITATAGGSPEAEAFLKSGLTKDIGNIVSNSPQLPWRTARGIRTRIGEYLENPQLIADGGTAQAKRLYGAISDDLRGTAQAVSPKAAQLFDLANKYTAQGHGYIEDVLTPIMSKDAAAAGSFMLNSAKTGDQIVGPLRQNMPKVADEMAAFKLRDMALSTPGQQNAAGTVISPSSFLTDWNNLSPEAKQGLYENPGVQRRVNALANIAGDVKQRQAMMNTSKTAHHGAITAMALAAGEGAARGYEAGGIPGAALGAGMGGAVIPAFNYGYSMFGANRPLARFLAMQGAPKFFPGQSGVLGAGIGALNAPAAVSPRNE